GLAQSFYFSSRRRHTRWPRDWSSDVCSSDLHLAANLLQFAQQLLPQLRETPRIGPRSALAADPLGERVSQRTEHPKTTAEHEERSEERRVGKECRARRSPDREKKRNESSGEI